MSAKLAYRCLVALVLMLFSTSFTPVKSTLAQDDMAYPTFTHPTEITNLYLPLALNRRVVWEGEEDGETLRIEVTLMPYTRAIEWAGGSIEAVVLQDIAYADGEIIEVTYDYFAQADDGGVYYLGEDVTNYDAGQIEDHEGTWLVGREGALPGLIMPAEPTVGMSFNPENLPGIVFETTTVIRLDEPTTTLDGASATGLLLEELQMDGAIEHKVYVAGVGMTEERADDAQVNLVSIEPVGDTYDFIQADLASLAELEAEVQVSVEVEDFEAAAIQVTTIKAIWSRARPFMQGIADVSTFIAYETSINNQWAAILDEDGETLSAEAQTSLSLLSSFGVE